LSIVYCQNQKVPITAPARDSISFQSGILRGLDRGFTVSPILCNLRIKETQNKAAQMENLLTSLFVYVMTPDNAPIVLLSLIGFSGIALWLERKIAGV
jgi:hypothetical protein